MAPGTSGHLETTWVVCVPRDWHAEVPDTWNSLSTVQKRFCHLRVVLPDVIFHGIVIIIQMAKISPASGFGRNLLRSAASLQSCILILSPL